MKLFCSLDVILLRSINCSRLEKLKVTRRPWVCWWRLEAIASSHSINRVSDVWLCYLCETLRKGISGVLSWYGYCAVLHLTFRTVAFLSWGLHVKEWHWDFGKHISNLGGHFFFYSRRGYSGLVGLYYSFGYRSLKFNLIASPYNYNGINLTYFYKFFSWAM